MPAAVSFLTTLIVVLALPELPDPGRLWPALLLQLLWPVARFRWAAASAAAVLLVVAVGQARLADDWSCARDREPHEVTGRIAQPPARRARSTSFLLDTAVDPAAGRFPRRVLVHWYGDAPALVAGETWRLRLRLRCRHGWRNPGGFDRELDLLRRGIGATATVMREGGRRLAPPDARLAVEGLRQQVAARVAASVTEPRVQGLVQGLAVGLRAEIPAAVWRSFVATGTVHLLAISGMHVTAFAAWLLAGIALLYRLPLPPVVCRARLPLTIVVMGLGTSGYALLAGASVPTLRTSVGVALLLALRALRRHAQPASWLLATGVAIAATDPLALATPGFWLSFLAVAALLGLYTAPARGMRSRATALLRAQAAVTLGLAVPLALFFGSLSWVAPLANLVAVPFFGGLVLPPVLAGVALTTLGLGLDAAAYALAGRLLETVLPLLEWLAGSGGALHYLAPVPGPALAFAGGLFALALWLPLGSLRGLALIAGLALLGARDVRPPAGAAELVLFDVGQGLAAAVLTRNHATLFDTGPAFMGDSSAAVQTLVPYLAMRQVRRLDVLVVSHPDADHAGGSAAVRSMLAPRRVFAGGSTLPPGAIRCRQGQRWRHDGVQFEVLHPPPGAGLGDNDGSCVLLVRTRAARALLTADIGARIEAEATHGWAQPVDLVLVPHHGSRHSSSTAFVAATHPRLALVSAGFGNRWGMPADRVVAAWHRAGATLLRTDHHGAIRVQLRATPPALGVTTEREAARRWWQSSPW